MKTLEWTTEDKSKWGPGEWQNEPDKKQWIDQETGLPCLIVRGPSGALCGYVGVDELHPHFENEYSDVDVEVHGGLTFAGFCAKTDDPSKHICHMVEPGENDRVYWFGFDCAHAWDLSPSMNQYDFHRAREEETYRNIHYVEQEVASLAKQLKALSA